MSWLIKSCTVSTSELRITKDNQAAWIVCTGQSHMARPHRAATCLRMVTQLALGPRLLPLSGPWG